MALTGGDPSRAPWLMTRYGCAGCHTIGGVPDADGQVGPPLKGLIERVYIGGTAPNNAENLVRWLVEPQHFAPHAAMPPPGLDEGEARDIAAYLYAHCPRIPINRGGCSLQRPGLWRRCRARWQGLDIGGNRALI